MDIDESQLAGKPKQIGLLKGKKVMLVSLKGGYHMVWGSKDGAWEPLGAGSHPCVAQHIAEKHAPGITWTSLNKSDYVPLEAYQDLLPAAEDFTDAVRRQWSLRGE